MLIDDLELLDLVRSRVRNYLAKREVEAADLPADIACEEVLWVLPAHDC